MTLQQKFDEIVSRLTIKHRVGNQFTCVCPAHDDSTASLSVGLADDKILIHCHAGCDLQDILRAIDKRPGALFADGDKIGGNGNGHREVATKEYKQHKPSPSANASPKQGEIETVYPYYDLDNNLIFEVVRLKPKSFRQRRPDLDNPGQYVWNMEGVTRVPYNLANVKAAITNDAYIYIVEGEKDVHTLQAFKCVATCNPGGAGKWLDFYAEYLRGAHIIILPDNDRPGCDHALQVACSLVNVAASIKVLQLPNLPAKGDVSDWLKSNNPKQFIKLVETAAVDWVPGMPIDPNLAAQSASGNHNGDSSDGSDLTDIIVTNRQQRDITNEAITALEANQHAHSLFIRMGRLVRLRTQISSKIQAPEIDEVNPDIVRHMMSLTANYKRITSRDDILNCAPPIDIARDIIARGMWEFPHLDAVTESPVMRPDGSVLTEPGYDESTRLYYAPSGALTMPEIPTNPTANEIAAARDCIEDILWDFPFVTPADKANLIGMMLTQIIRPAIDGQIPIAIVDAPQPGSGKGLLTKVINLIATGKPLAAMTAPTVPEEWPKVITSQLASGTTMIVFDNLETTLDNPDLAALITMSEWSGRILGQSKILTIPNRATVLVTGNNVTTGGDIARRCYWTTINPQTSTPELRKGFRHANLCKHVLNTRGDILSALFTMARAWYASGQPDPPTPIIGSFDEWSRIVGGILQHSGINDFLGNAETHRADADAYSSENERFLRAIFEEWRGGSFTVKELNTLVSQTDAVSDAVPDYLMVARSKSEASFVRACGKLFSKIAGRRFGQENVAIFKMPVTHAHRVIWVVKCDKPTKLENDIDGDVRWI